MITFKTIKNAIVDLFDVYQFSEAGKAIFINNQELTKLKQAQSNLSALIRTTDKHINEYRSLGKVGHVGILQGKLNQLTEEMEGVEDQIIICEEVERQLLIEKEIYLNN